MQYTKKFNLQPQLLLWLFPDSSSPHHGPWMWLHNHQASQSPPPLVPGTTDDKQKHNSQLWILDTSLKMLSNQPTNQVFVCFPFKGELSPANESDLGEDVALQQVLEQQPSRFPRSAEDKTAFILLPEVLLQGLHVLSHAVCHHKPTTVLATWMNTGIVYPKCKMSCAGQSMWFKILKSGLYRISIQTN